MSTIDPRKQKIRTLKEEIKIENDKLTEILAELDIKKELELTKEEQEKNKQEWKDRTEVKRVEISNIKQELKQTRMNKNSSAFFEFMPTMANRRMRRQARKLRRA